MIGDADTGYGNALNVKRTVHGYAQAGFAAAMIEDQLAPKRCGHTRGKDVVSRGEALARIRAAVDARDEGAGILVLARTDARGRARSRRGDRPREGVPRRRRRHPVRRGADAARPSSSAWRARSKARR